MFVVLLMFFSRYAGAPVGGGWVSFGDCGDRDLAALARSSPKPLASGPSAKAAGRRSLPWGRGPRTVTRGEIDGEERPQPRGARPAEYRRPASRPGRSPLSCTCADNGTPLRAIEQQSCPIVRGRPLCLRCSAFDFLGCDVPRAEVRARGAGSAVGRALHPRRDATVAGMDPIRSHPGRMPSASGSAPPRRCVVSRSAPCVAPVASPGAPASVCCGAPPSPHTSTLAAEPGRQAARA